MPSRTRPRSKNNSLPHGSPAVRPVKELFAAAVRSHLANELDAAEKGYRTVLSLEPTFAEALNNLGVLLRSRDAVTAHSFFERAVDVRPKYTEALFNLGLSFMQRADFAQSVKALRAILAIDPNHGRAWNEMTCALRGLGEFDASLEAAHRAVQLLPDDAATHNNLGNVLLQSGHLDEARASYERALAIFADFPEAINNLGTAYRGMRLPEKALPLFLRALELKPGYLDAMHNLALGLPNDIAGSELIELRLRAEVKRAPESADVLGVLAIYLQESGRFDEAREIARTVVTQDSNNIDGWTVLGICAAEALDLREAIRCYDRALEIDPRAGVVRWNRAIAFLGLGDYEEGWNEYEARWQLVQMALDRRLVDRQEWSGEPLGAKTVLVYTEQGLGDAIQFARFGAELKRRNNGARIIVGMRPFARFALRDLRLGRFDHRSRRRSPDVRHSRRASQPSAHPWRTDRPASGGSGVHADASSDREPHRQARWRVERRHRVGRTLAESGARASLDSTRASRAARADPARSSAFAAGRRQDRPARALLVRQQDQRSGAVHRRFRRHGVGDASARSRHHDRHLRRSSRRRVRRSGVGDVDSQRRLAMADGSHGLAVVSKRATLPADDGG